VWYIPLGLPRRCGRCANIQQVAEEEEEEEEEEEDTPHVDTWHNASVWVDFFGGFH
jgi:pyruvate-formate lyase-activating enzyme